MDEHERLNRIAVALRRAYELVEEDSEMQGYIAEALAYADGDLSSFDDDEHNLEDDDEHNLEDDDEHNLEDEVDTYHGWDCTPAELTAEIEQLREENKQLRRAVAVAPELLLCLTEVLDADGDLYVMDFDRYRAAIAKAKKEILEHNV